MGNIQHEKHGGSRRNTARRNTAPRNTASRNTTQRNTARQTRRTNQSRNTTTKTTAKTATTSITSSTSTKPFRFDELNPTQQRRRTWIAGIVVATVFAGSLITCATRVAAFTPTFQREVSCKELAHKGDVAKDNLNKAATEAREKLDLLTSATKENDVELYDFVRTHKKEIEALSNTLDEIENEPVDNFACDKNATKKDAQFYRDDIAVQTNKLQRAIFPVFGNVEHLTIVKVCREIATEVANQEATIATMEEKFRALDDRVNKAQQALNEATEKDAARIEFVANDAPLKSDEVQGTQSALQGAASRIQELRTQSETLTPPQPCKSGITRINHLHDPQAQSHEAQSYGDMITTLDELEKNTTPNITRAHEFADHAEKTYQARVAKHEEVVAQREAERKRQELAAKQRAEANRLKLNTMSSQELEKLQGGNEDNLPEGVSKQHVETALHNAREREEAERRAQESAEEAQARREAEAKARERAKREAQQRNQDMQTRATQQRPAISQQRQQTQNQRRQSQQRQNRQRQNQQRQQPRQQQHQQRQQTRTQEGVRSQERKRQQQQHIRQQHMQQKVQ